ncbi:MAG: hypothetical protein J0I09_10450 [Sphingobacteriia bacterium]|nr:hypothetical protein [Sphingobacteriia bacterium]
MKQRKKTHKTTKNTQSKNSEHSKTTQFNRYGMNEPFYGAGKISNPNSNTVGVVIDLIKMNGSRVPVMFETDREEMYELINKIKEVKDLKIQQEGWFRIMAFVLSEIAPIDHSFFNAALLSIASSNACVQWFNENKNEPVAFAVMLQEGRYGYEVLQMTYKVWTEVFDHYKTTSNLRSGFLNKN